VSDYRDIGAVFAPAPTPSGFAGLAEVFGAAPAQGLLFPHPAAPRIVLPDLSTYDYIIVAFSGGKDSLACLLHLLELGVERSRIELWHHLVDGREGSTLMDWPCTEAYCRAVAAGFQIPIYFSWRKGGFEGEMDRDGTPTGPVMFETPDGLHETGGQGPPGNRHKLFPMAIQDLRRRWCSAVLKIDVGRAALRNQRRFDNRRTLFLTGERSEESPARAKYAVFEPHDCDLRNGRVPRHIDAWRAVHDFSRRQVWKLIERYRVNPHPAYRLGFSRVSCAGCIFGTSSPDQFSSLRAANLAQFRYMVRRERLSGKTIDWHHPLPVIADMGTPYEMDEGDIRAATSQTFDEPVFVTPWKEPQGAYGDSKGPT
jgi:3'-phosphoadenosine 5'-phosphosulfate sulfotransferase (PAPS reductase)/FAD synthetase